MRMVMGDRSAEDVSGTALEGAAAGGVATLVMSAVMLLAGRAGLMGKQPPLKIAEAALDAAGQETRDPKVVKPLAALLHLGFGAAAGALFAVLHRRLRPPVPAELHGVLFGLGVWLVSYRGWMPGLGIMPPPERDRPGRPVVMVLAHCVFGAVLGALVRSGVTRLR